MKILTFILGSEMFGVDGSRVSELSEFKLEDVALVPRQPKHMLGVTNLRGTVIPVCDLRLAFAFSECDYTDKTICLVVIARVDGEDKKVGLIVDSVETVVGVDIENLPPKKLDGNITEDFIVGVQTVKDELLSILDIDSIVNRKLEMGVV